MFLGNLCPQGLQQKTRSATSWPELNKCTYPTWQQAHMYIGQQVTTDYRVSSRLGKQTDPVAWVYVTPG